MNALENLKLGMVTQAGNPSILRAEEGNHKFEASLTVKMTLPQLINLKIAIWKTMSIKNKK